MRFKNKKNIWPDSEVPCIWMEAGIIDYKLCDRHQDCDHCPFDAIMKSGKMTSSVSNDQIEKDESNPISAKLAQNTSFAFNSTLNLNHQFDPDTYYGRKYWFFKPTGKNKVSIGISARILTFLPPVKEIILTQSSLPLKKGNMFCWIVTNFGTLRLASPVSGTVTEINPDLISQLNTKSFDKKEEIWFLRLYSNKIKQEYDQFLKGSEAKDYLNQYHAHISETFEQAARPYSKELGPTMQDGGVRLTNYEEMIPPRAYFKIICEIFQCMNR